MISVEGLTKVYGHRTALDNVTFDVPRGEIFGFVGPNGAGKTTTLRILAALLEPTAGRAIVDGADVVQYPDRVHERLGYMPDFFGVYDQLTAAEYLDFYAACYRQPKARRKKIADDLLELVGLSDRRDQAVDTLSRGLKQRLCLARALVHDPAVLLLDEPASGLDPRARVEMREILKELQKMGKTIVISSHILPELTELCTMVGIIDQGRMRATGPVQDVIRQLTKGGGRGAAQTAGHDPRGHDGQRRPRGRVRGRRFHGGRHPPDAHSGRDQGLCLQPARGRPGRRLLESHVGG